ncbi:hypothetical protein MDAP_001181 [Mitosporidium daphniae]
MNSSPPSAPSFPPTGEAAPAQQLQKQKNDEAKQMLMLSRVLSPEARDRLQSYLLQMSQRGALSRPLDDKQLISLLSQVGGLNEADCDVQQQSPTTFVKRKSGIDDDEDLDLSQFGI